MRTPEQIRRIWESLLVKYGAYEFDRRMSKMESYRLYYRKYPYDGKTPVLSLDETDNTPGVGPDLQEQLIMKQTTETYLAKLTDKQREIVKRTSEGYRPREIAEMQGDENSGKVRFNKFAAKEKLIEHLNEE